MCLYLYIHNKYTQYTHICYVNKNFYFWMRLIAINNLTALLQCIACLTKKEKCLIGLIKLVVLWRIIYLFFFAGTWNHFGVQKGGWILMPSLTLFSGSTGWWVVMFKLTYLKETVLGSVYRWVDSRTIWSDAFLVQLHTGSPRGLKESKKV